ncbi:MAG: hypothetical protein HONDAALG_02444 [Gammaproteobacteria bacterium]|nr:hypothetical protein [Gammaproteobacteria bacterium]
MSDHLTVRGRRRFLATIATTVLAPAVLLPGGARALAAPVARRIAFVHTHTGERLSTVYAEDGAYLPDALAAINRLLRDFRTGDVHPIDPALLDQLAGLTELTGGSGCYEVICGYRSPRTNAMLREHGSGVAKGSLHLQGRAIDVRLPGVPLAELRDAARHMAAGGVGYYPKSDFIHMDTGRVRSW